MDANRLKMNSSKTEFILFGHRKQLQKCMTSSINVNGNTVHRSPSIKYLGVTLDEELTHNQHIKQKCKTAMYGIHRIKSIRSTITKDAAETLALGIVISHLDYANAIFIGLPQTAIAKLNRVKHIAARVVLGREAESLRNKECLKKLHWLPIQLRIQFKILFLVYKALHNTAPEYIRSMLTLSNPSRNLRSSSMYKKLEVPTIRKKTFANRSFSVHGPIWWN
ncbi:hypothetical protein SNE40_002924 [Patella caerulea]|uniref:Reverse transcriptase n=1 Tax=Patella caerulea TaxID=87958 RepID=A0AAN8K8Q2_PATCE